MEDDEFARFVLEGMIEAVGSEYPSLTFRVKMAGTAEKALAEAKAADETFLVLLDYQLPDTNADRVLPQLRKAVGNLSAIVMLSAHQEPLERCLALGADAARLKPVSVHVIKELFDYALKKRQFLLMKRRRVASRSASRSESADRLDVLGGGGGSGSRGGSGGGSRAFELMEKDPLSELAQGRSGETHLGVLTGKEQASFGRIVVIKLHDAKAARGEPPPYVPSVPTREPSLNLHPADHEGSQRAALSNPVLTGSTRISTACSRGSSPTKATVRQPSIELGPAATARRGSYRCFACSPCQSLPNRGLLSTIPLVAQACW